ncbi:recombinase family protein, partial [Roseomonas mucosa]
SRGAHRWHVRMEAALRPDITIAARLDEGNEAIRDYYFLPRAETGLTRLRLAEENGFSLDAFRFESLDPLFELAARTTIPGVT